MKNKFREKCLECSEAISDGFNWLRRNFIRIFNGIAKVVIIILLAIFLYSAGKFHGIKELQVEMAKTGVAKFICDPTDGDVTWVVIVPESHTE